MSTNLDTLESSSDAVVSTEAPSNSDVAISDEVKVNIAVGADLLESNAGTLTINGDTAVHDSVNDTRVSGDEKGTVVENVEMILEEKEKEVNDEEKEGEYKVSDLVWAKVRNYPWWPGQIFDPSSATDIARKHSNKKGFLVAYFGDQTFAWNEKSKIKPFRKNFSKMQKQSDSKKFHHAVDCALDEALRRTEFGLSCSCVSKEVFEYIKSQTFMNAGIKKEDSRIEGGDRFSTVSTFKPANIAQSVQDLAREHFDGFNKLQVLSLNTQLFAYYRWKGYHQFSTQYFLDGLDNKLEDNSESEIPLTAKPDSPDIPLITKPDSPDEKVSSKKRKLKDSKIVKDAKPKPKPKPASVSDKVSKKRKSNGSESVNSQKHKHARNGDTVPKKKEKLLIEDSGKSRNGIADRKSSSIPTPKKPLIPPPKRLFGIGESICKIAKQLSVSPLIPKKESESQFQKSKESNSNRADQNEESTKSHESTNPETKSGTSDSSKEKLTALIPNKESESQFQRSKESNSNRDDQTEESTKSETKSEASDSSKEKLTAPFPNKESESQFQRSKESNSNCVDQTEESTKSEASDSTKEKSSTLIPNNESESQFQRSKESNSNHLDQTTESTKSETSDSTLKPTKPNLTALILKFTNFDSIPPVKELNEIFTTYGSLMESETEVLKKSNCAKVVFQEKSNAESAFSSAGKFSIFGPSLISYRLDYSPTPRKIYTRKGKKKNGGDSV